MTTTDKPDSVAATLRAARALIEDPKRWRRGSLARTTDGIDVSPEDPRAASWCSAGALQRVTIGNSALYERARWRFLKANHLSFIAELNDTSNHNQVLIAFDKAIAAAEQAAVS